MVHCCTEYLKTTIFCIAGENEGFDKLAGRYRSCSSNVKCICQYCDIPTLELGTPNDKFNYLTNKQMNGDVTRENTQELHILFHHSLPKNIFFKLIFCNRKCGF